MQKREWKGYNERLVRRGELLISLDFLESWNDELKEMNKEKRGRPYEFPQNFIQFMAYVHVLFLLLIPIRLRRIMTQRSCVCLKADGGISEKALRLHTPGKDGRFHNPTLMLKILS